MRRKKQSDNQSFDQEVKATHDVDTNTPAFGFGTDPDVKMYLREMRQYDLLTAEEEHLLVQRVAQGDIEAQQRLVEANLRLVVSIAKKYTAQGIALLDLVQEGNLGLIHAAHKFDPARGYRFSTYAVWWVRKAMGKAVIKNYPMHIPPHVVEEMHTIVRITQRLTQELGRDPSLEEIAQAAHLPKERVVELQNLGEAPLSLDIGMLGDDEDYRLSDLLPEPARKMTGEDRSLQVLMDQIVSNLHILTPRERLVIEMLYDLFDGETLTRDELSLHFKVTRERIRQIEVEALRKLRLWHASHLLSMQED